MWRFCLVFLVACDGAPGTVDDAGPVDAAPDVALPDFAVPTFWAPDAEAGPPDFEWSCGQGDGLCPAPTLDVCDPGGWPVPGATCIRPFCPFGEGPDGACTPPAASPGCDPLLVVDGACPTAPCALPEATLYVDDDAPNGGDGSPERPLRQILEAIRRGAVIVGLLPGTYQLPDDPLLRNAMLRGTCAAEVVVEGPLRIEPGATLQLERLAVTGGIEVAGGSLSLYDAVVRDGATAAIDVAGGDARLTAVRIEAGEGMGLRLTAGRVQVDGLHVRDRAQAGVRVLGGEVTLNHAALVDTWGLRAQGGTLRFTNLHVIRGFTAGLYAYETALVTGSGLYVADTRIEGTAVGVLVADGASLDVTGGHLIRAGVSGLVAQDGGTLAIRDTVVEAGLSNGSGVEGAVLVQLGGQATLAEVVLQDAPQWGLAVTGDGSTVAVDGLRIADIGPSAQDVAVAIVVQAGATLTGQRISYEGPLLVQDGGEATLERVHGIAEIGAATAFRDGHLSLSMARLEAQDVALACGGLMMMGTPTCTAHRVGLLVDREGRAAVQAAAGELTLTDAWVEGGRIGVSAFAPVRLERTTVTGAGNGLELQPGVEADATDVFFLENADVAVLVGEGGRFGGTRILARGGGQGVVFRPGATGLLDGAWLDGVSDYGLAVAGENTAVTARRVHITDLRQGDERTPAAIAVADGGQATLEHVHLARNRSFGIGCTGGTFEATDLTIVDTLGTELGTSGVGLTLSAGCTATLTRTHLARNRTFGLLAVDPDTAVTATDLLVQDQLPDDTDRAYGVLAVGSTLDLRGALIERGQFAGLAGTDRAHITAESLWIRDTPPGPGAADGLVVQQGSTFEGRTVLLTDHPGSAVLVENAALSLDQAFIARSGVGITTRLETTLDLKGLIFLENGEDRRCEGTCVEAPDLD